MIRQKWRGTLVHVRCEKQIKVMCPLSGNEEGMGTLSVNRQGCH